MMQIHLRRWLLPLIVLACFQANAFSQALRGAITDANGKPLEAATLSLLRSADSTLVKVELSDAAGQYEFSGLKPDTYRIAASLLGFEQQMSRPLEISTADVALPPITLPESAQALQEVTVAAQRPFIERRSDRLIVNVDNSIMATGSTAFEILGRSPGVIVSANDAITIRGRAGTIIMIDGKPTPLAGQDLANYLRALPSGSIDRIEVITNPSAKYDAAGNAGIIDIRLKKDKSLGTNGSANAYYSQGVYPKFGAGFTFNHRQKKWNLFGNYNYSDRDWMNDLQLYRTFYENGQPTGAYDQRNLLILPFHFHNGRVGADYFLSPSTTVGVLASGSLNRYNARTNNFSDVENGAGERIGAFNTTNAGRDKWPMLALNGNLKHSFRQKGREISVDLDYIQFGNTTAQNYTTRYFDTEGVEYRPPYLLVGDLHGDLKIRSAKADYTHPLGSMGKLEAGLKSSLVDADNELEFYDKSDAAHPILDTTISNHFLYRENINAAYLNYSREWAKFSLQAGLRAENTVAKGNQLTTGQTFDRNYVNWFPSTFLTYQFSEKYTMGLNMSRRLDRPTYDQLNPFKSFLDPSTLKVGNPYLNPQFTWSFEWNHTFRQRYTATLSYAVTVDNITQVIGPVEGLERVTAQTDRNLAQAEYYTLSLSAPLQPFKWWNSINSLDVYQGLYKGDFANTTVNDGNLVLFFNNNNTFTLKNDWSAELNFRYKTHEVYGFMDINPMWGLGFGVQKQCWNRQVTLKLAFTDVFWTDLPSATIRYRDYTEVFDVRRETRLATLSISYRFGSNQVAQARRRSGGAEEERRRAGGS
ncbi:MAG: TonB-dependent receptor [Saprospiraceae bacterium]|nr:TonB-dependent receptor [Saprospiraceae bacterium]